MPIQFSKVDMSKTARLRPFKIKYDAVRTLDYMDRQGRPPMSFAQYKNKFKFRPSTRIAQEQPRPVFSADLKHLQSYSAGAFPNGKMLILVNPELYPSVQASIEQYVQDLAYAGYFATVYTINTGKPAELRNFLKTSQPIVGAVMVGALPVAWYEIPDHGEFPCDLYYMDLNGTWNDPDGDGKFSEHPTGVEAEIWIGRLWTPTSDGNDAALINDYFKRNHLYRKGLFGMSNKALAFVDDDWQGFGDCAFDSMFPAADIETIVNPTTTDGDRYKAEIQQFRAWAQICAHSGPGGHVFKVPGAEGEWVPNSYLRDINPPNAFFYNLFACSLALFTESEYMAGWYIFDKGGGSTCNGLAAIGSTKSGSMLAFENFYTPMGNGKVIGDALVEWWKALGSSHDANQQFWYYGLTLLGDPTLNWWTGVVPALRNPYDGDTFDHFPRLLTLQWDPIPLSGATYNVEVDAFGAKAAGKWAAEVNGTYILSGAQPGTTYEHPFVGAQRGRWRVRANVSGRKCPWSDWRYFKCTV